MIRFDLSQECKGSQTLQEDGFTLGMQKWSNITRTYKLFNTLTGKKKDELYTLRKKEGKIKHFTHDRNFKR